LIHLFTIGESLENITEEQYFLASKVNISIWESNCLPVFEKEAFVNLMVKEHKERNENIGN
jgi:hypothetical protein